MFKHIADFLRQRKRNAIFVRCSWDDEAGVWYVAESSIEGLAADAESIDELVHKIKLMITDLLEDQGEHSGTSDDGAGSVPFELLVNGSSQGHVRHG